MDTKLSAKKSWGQHFLVDHNYCNKIVSLADIRKGDLVLEIGPGTGLLTRRLLAAGSRVVAVEIDPDMVTHLRESVPATGSQLAIIQSDVLRLNWEALSLPPSCKVVGNLPYNIATAIILQMMEIKHRFHSLVFMLQKEVAQRLLARPGDSDYGYISVLCRYHFDAEPGFHVPPGAFRPPPRVDSQVLRLIPRQEACDPVRGAALEAIVSRAFAQRRKTLLNNLRAAGLPRELAVAGLKGCGIGAKARAQELSPEQFLCLARMLQSAPGKRNE